MNALLYFWPLLAQHWRKFLTALSLSLLTLAAGIALLGVSGWFLTAAALTWLGVAFNLFAPSAGVRGLAFVRILSRYGERVTGHEATLKLLSDLRRWIFGRLFAVIPLPGIGLHRADLVNRLVSDVDALDNALLVTLMPMAGALCVGGAMTAGIAVVVPAAAPCYALCFAAATLAVPMLLALMAAGAGRGIVAQTAALRLAVLQGLDLHQELVALGETGWAESEATSASRRLGQSQRRIGRLTALATLTSQLFAGMAVLAVLVAGIATLEAGRIDPAVLVALLLATIASFEVVVPLLRGVGRFGAATAAASRLKSIAELDNPIAEPDKPAPLGSGGHVEFEAVSFAYDRSRSVLAGLSLDIPSGAHIGIAGPSGCGKSTLARLLVRLADPTAGAVKLNGIDVRTIDSSALRRRVALMTQDAPVFHDSIRNNLLIGNPLADDARLWQALGEVGLAEAVGRLPAGLDTELAEDGNGLSVGQSRRVALARTLLSPADVIVLDEPTSGLDRDAEQQFFATLGSVAAGRTLIVITHAVAASRALDVVYEMRDGVLRPAN